MRIPPYRNMAHGTGALIFHFEKKMVSFHFNWKIFLAPKQWIKSIMPSWNQHETSFGFSFWLFDIFIFFNNIFFHLIYFQITEPNYCLMSKHCRTQQSICHCWRRLFHSSWTVKYFFNGPKVKRGFLKRIYYGFKRLKDFLPSIFPILSTWNTRKNACLSSLMHWNCLDSRILHHDDAIFFHRNESFEAFGEFRESCLLGESTSKGNQITYSFQISFNFPLGGTNNGGSDKKGRI